jgi:hypothetical protein
VKAVYLLLTTMAYATGQTDRPALYLLQIEIFQKKSVLTGSQYI